MRGSGAGTRETGRATGARYLEEALLVGELPHRLCELPHRLRQLLHPRLLRRRGRGQRRGQGGRRLALGYLRGLQAAVQAGDTDGQRRQAGGDVGEHFRHGGLLDGRLLQAD